MLKKQKTWCMTVCTESYREKTTISKSHHLICHTNRKLSSKKCIIDIIFKYYRVVRLMKVILVHILQRSKDRVCWSIITSFAQIKSPNKSHNLSLVITSICIQYYSFLMMCVYCFSFLMTKIKVVQYLSQSQERLSTSETNTQATRRSYIVEYTHSRKFSIFLSKYKLRRLHHLLINPVPREQCKLETQVQQLLT